MDLNALQQKINNYITVVSSWVRNVGKLYFSSTPENVTVELLDDNGNVVTKSMPNVAQFRKRVWDDIGGALGQFNRAVHVDAVNGSDSNSGGANSPFKTLYKAITSAPIGSITRIHLQSDIDMSNEPGSSPVNSKSVVIYMDGHNITASTDDSMRHIYIGGGEAIGFIKMMPTQGNETIIVTEQPLIVATDCFANIHIGDFDNKLTINTSVRVVQLNRAKANVFVDNTDVNCDTDNQVLVNGEFANVLVRSNCKLNNIVATSTRRDNLAYLRAHPYANQVITLFVDAVNGSDSNSGYDKNFPLKTLKKAMQRCAIDKNNQIRLLSDVTQKSSDIIASYDIDRKAVQIINDDVENPCVVTLEVDDSRPAIQMNKSAHVSFQVDVAISNTYDNAKRNAINILGNSTVEFLYKQNNTETTLTIGDNASAAWVRDSSIVLANDISLSDTNAAIFSVARSARIGVEKAKTLNGSTITDADISQNVLGVIKDANGVPRNINSNIIF